MEKKKFKLTRRQFLQASAVTGAILGTSGVFRFTQKATAEDLIPKDVKYVRTTCSPNCTGNCGMQAKVVDGQIKTIIQAADYPEQEYNPRGCLRGISMMNLIYGPDRLEKPLIRQGKPGGDDFKEVSWDEALDHTISRLKEIADKYGPESIGYMYQVAGAGYVHKGAGNALASQAGWRIFHAYDQNGDLPMFWPMTFGVQTEELEPLEWADSRYIAVFGSNIMVTRLPDAKFIEQAQDKGAKMVVFDPNYSPTAAKADEWVQVNAASDAALALGMAKVIIDEKLYDEEFIKTFTDLPLLVRVDNGKRLKAEEVQGLSKPADVAAYREAYVAYNGGFITVHPEKLDLPLNIIIEGEVEVQLVNGQKVKAKPGFQLLKESLKTLTPDYVKKETNVPWETVARIAREMATTKPLHVIYGASNYQWYHGDLKGRALALLPVLTGNIGKTGAGISTYCGSYKVRLQVGEWWYPVHGEYVPWLYVLHGPTKEMTAHWPKNGIKALIMGWSNAFDQHNMANRLRKMVEDGDLEFVVNIDFQKTTSTRYANVVLPGVSWYEKTELVATPVHPYLQLQQAAIKPLFEGKPELWIFRELAKRLNPEFESHYFPGLDPDAAAEKAIELMLKTGGPTVEGITLEQLKKGPVRMKSPAPGNRQLPFYDQVQNKKPFPPQSLPVAHEKTKQFVKSGRIEFYKDEDMFIKLGETLPVHKPPFVESEYALNPEAKEKYQFAFISRNALYRVHSTHSNNIWMNELQDGKPRVWVNPKVAAAKGIKQDDMVELYNDRGSVTGHAVLDPGCDAKVVVFEQGWWSRYLNGAFYNSLTYPFIKPTHEIYFVPGMWAPNTAWNECLCDVRKVGEK